MNVSAASWSHPPSYGVAKSRVIGRTRYHQWLKQAARARRELVRLLLMEYGWHRAGVLDQIAAEVGCHKSTICRDRQILRDQLALW